MRRDHGDDRAGFAHELDLARRRRAAADDKHRLALQALKRRQIIHGHAAFRLLKKTQIKCKINLLYKKIGY